MSFPNSKLLINLKILFNVPVTPREKVLSEARLSCTGQSFARTGKRFMKDKYFFSVNFLNT